MKALTKTALRADKAIRIVTAALREHRDVFASGLGGSFRAFLSEDERVALYDELQRAWRRRPAGQTAP